MVLKSGVRREASMEGIVEAIGVNTLLEILFVVTIILLIVVVTLLFKTAKLQKRYEGFMKKIGNGKNIEEDLENYIYRVEKVEGQNAQLANHINTINSELVNCIQKIGMVRYNAFKDTGSDLSFALALLDQNNNGVVLNGIYSREMSNIYAKPVENGVSAYTLSEEETQAIQKATQSSGGVCI